MQRQKQLFLFLFITITVSFLGLVVPESTHAQTSLLLPITPIAQRFSPPDPNGDTGTHDCMAAALTMALNTLVDKGMLSRTESDLSYASIRQYLRLGMPDNRRGIAPSLLIEGTGNITDGSFHMSLESIKEENWREFLQGELTKGFPVIVHVADRNSLYNPRSQSSLSHVVVVYGMSNSTLYYVDPWDGRSYEIPHEVFASAWGKGHYSWLAFQLHKKEFTSFRELLSRLNS